MSNLRSSKEEERFGLSFGSNILYRNEIYSL